MKKLALILAALFWVSSMRAEEMNISREYEEKLVERVKQVYGLLPASYGEKPPHPMCMTPVMLEYGLVRGVLSEKARKELSSLDERPSYQADVEYIFDSPDGHSRIHYAKTGTHAVYQYWIDVNPADGHPDYVNRCAEVCERVWEIEVDSMGYYPPPSDSFYTPNGGDGRYDIYILGLQSGYLGWTSPENALPSNNKSYTSYIVLRNDFHLYYSPYIDGVEVTLAHEFFHAIQYGYDAYEPFSDLHDQNSYNPYWMEMTATWMEDMVYDEVNDYIWYLQAFYFYPWLSLKSFSFDFGTPQGIHPYGSCVWPIYLGENYGKDIIREIWDGCAEIRGSNSWSATGSRVGDIQEAFRDFTVWNFFTGDRADTSKYYSEGNLWYYGSIPIQIDSIPELKHDSYPVEADSIPRQYQPQGLAGAYIFFAVNPNDSDSVGGLRVEFYGRSSGSWKGSIVGYSDSLISIDTLLMSQEKQDGVGQVINWGRFSHIIFVPVLLNGDTTGHDFKYFAFYDSSLTDEPTSPNIIKVLQSCPNPFVVGGEEDFVSFPMIINEVTYVEINVFTVSGELVKKVYKGSLAAGDYSRRDAWPGLIPAMAWDGKNEKGQRVASGIYLYQIKTKSAEVLQKMALIRK